MGSYHVFNVFSRTIEGAGNDKGETGKTSGIFSFLFKIRVLDAEPLRSERPEGRDIFIITEKRGHGGRYLFSHLFDVDDLFLCYAKEFFKDLITFCKLLGRVFPHVKYAEGKGYKYVMTYELYDMPGKKIYYVMQGEASSK